MAFLELFLTFFMIGAVTVGGGYAMLPLMQEQVAAHWGTLSPPMQSSTSLPSASPLPAPLPSIWPPM